MNTRTSKNITLIAAVAFALLVGATTLMPPGVYSSWWWFALWAAVAVAIAVAMVWTGCWRQPVLLCVHLSLIIMIAGGGMTFLTAERGTMHLEPNKACRSYTADGGGEVRLPFDVTLLKFTTDYYPGMSFPRDFHSRIRIDSNRIVDISMNRIAREGDYRLYQTSFDGKGGSVLTVTRDPWGIGLTYLGYALFAVSGLLLLLRKAGLRFRKALPTVAIALSFYSADAQAAPAVEQSMSDSLQTRQIIFNGRVMSFARMSSELTLKLTGKTHVGELDPTRFITSLMIYPDEWRSVPFVSVKSRRLRNRLGIDAQYVSLSQLYDSKGQYVLQKYYADGSGPLDSEILKLDEKVALLDRLWKGTAFQPLDSVGQRRDRRIINLETLYYRIQPVRCLFMVTLAVALLGFVCLAVRRGFRMMRWCLIALFIIATGIFAWLWLINGSIPLDGTFGILYFVALCMLGILITVSRRNPLATTIGMLAAGFVMLMSWLAAKDPALTPLMPVLSSPWLGAHVSVIMASYAMLGLTFPLSLAAIFLARQRDALVALCRKLLYPGVYMLGIGIILGAMWANVSWGRYWAWDPKETWAFVTMMLYSIPLHKSLYLNRRPIFLSIYLSLAFLSIVMTYAGVNYFTSSLHAYR